MPGCWELACDLHASGRRKSAAIMRPVLLLMGLLSATKAFISVSPARWPASTLLRAEEDAGGPKRSLADAISAFSKGALSREELEGAVKAEEAAAAAALAKEKAIRDAKEKAQRQKQAIGAGSVLGRELCGNQPVS